jgi:hypothetical protein
MVDVFFRLLLSDSSIWCSFRDAGSGGRARAGRLLLGVVVVEIMLLLTSIFCGGRLAVASCNVSKA